MNYLTYFDWADLVAEVLQWLGHVIRLDNAKCQRIFYDNMPDRRKKVGTF